LNRPELQARFPAMTPKVVEAFLTEIATHSILGHPVPKAFTWRQHPDDDHVFNLAILVQTDYLVTWEQRLLNFFEAAGEAAAKLRSLAPQLRIINPKQFTA